MGSGRDEVLGVLASVALIWHGLLDFTRGALIEEGVIYGGIGLAVSAAHARRRFGTPGAAREAGARVTAGAA